MHQNDVTRTQRKSSLTLALAAGLLAVAGCAHAKPVAEAAPAPAPVAEAPAPAPVVQPAVAEAPPAVQVSRASLYFDLDSSNLDQAGRDALSTLGDLLARNRDLTVRVEGNCDERGTAAYNLALGSRRAEAAKKYLLQMGATEGQVTTVSYGKERPKAAGHDESAWHENRRDDVIPSKESVPAKPVAVTP